MSQGRTNYVAFWRFSSLTLSASGSSVEEARSRLARKILDARKTNRSNVRYLARLRKGSAVVDQVVRTRVSPPLTQEKVGL